MLRGIASESTSTDIMHHAKRCRCLELGKISYFIFSFVSIVYGVCMGSQKDHGLRILSGPDIQCSGKHIFKVFI